MSAETQRALTQAVIALTTICFSLGMVVRSWRQQGVVWPVPWNGVVGMYLAALALSFGVHALYWLGLWDVELRDPEMLAVLWLAAAMSVWAFLRWVRDER